MIYSISSSLPTFKNLVLSPGINLIVVDMGPNATEGQTRNRSGKSSVLEIVHFLLGANCPPDSIFRKAALADFSFSMRLDVGSAVVTVQRSGAEPYKVCIETDAEGWPPDLQEQFSGKTAQVSNDAWKDMLGRLTFGLPDSSQRGKYAPTYRALISYFARRASKGAYADPFRNAAQQKRWDTQMSMSFLLGLDWTLARDFQVVRDEEEEIDALKRSSSKGVLGSLVGKAADLRSDVARHEDECLSKKTRLDNLQVLPDYREREQQADEMAQRLAQIRGERVAAKRFHTQLKNSLLAENPPTTDDLFDLYNAAMVQLPEAVVQSFQEARIFHESVITNRRGYLQQQLQETETSIAAMTGEETVLQSRFSDAMRTLTASKAFDQYSALQQDLTRCEEETALLRERLKLAEALETKRTQNRANRAELQIRLQQDLHDRFDRVKRAMVVFSNVSRYLYEANPGSLHVADSPNGLDLNIDIQGSSSKGITLAKILCFDLTLMDIVKPGPGFLLHDSHAFDGVDSRQTAAVLRLADRLTRDQGFQYTATINSNDVPAELTHDFVADHRVNVDLSDDPESGGLFGIRF